MFYLLRRVLCILFIVTVYADNAISQLATYVGSGGTSIAVTSGSPNATVTNLLYTGFGTNTACGSGGRSGITVNTSWTTYSTVPTSPRVYIQILPAVGYQLNMTGFSAALRSSTTGPTCARFAYSLDNGATWTDDGACHAPNVTTTCGSAITSTWSGGTLPTGVTSTVNGIIVAIFPYLPGASTGTFQINRIDIAGTVTTACNSPSVTTGPTSVCSGQTIMLSNAATGGTWSSSNSTVASITPGRVVTGGTAGTAVITYATGCGTNATTTITVNPLPVAGTISGIPVVCPGATTPLSSNAAGGIWSSTMTSVATVNSSGVVYGVSAGSSNISYTVTNVCGTAATGIALTVNPLPVAGNVTGVPVVCENSNTFLNNATTGGVWSSGTTTVAIVNTTGMVSGIDSGVSVISYSVTNSCGTAVATSTVTVNPAPAVYTLTGGGSYCAGSGGLHVGLSGSETWISYQLYNGAAIGTALIGNSMPIDFGLQTGAGSYVAVGTNTTTGCATNMLGSSSIIVNPLPSVYSVTGGGAICSGIGGVNVGLSWSDAGINYQLYVAAIPSGGPVPGTNNPLDFGIKTTNGNYTVIATNPVTSCTANMLGTVAIAVTPSVTPSVIISAGSGAICSGSSRTFTASSVNGGSAPLYEWFVNGTLAGTGSSYTYIPANGNVIEVKLTSNAVCPLPATVTTSATLTVQNTEMPFVNVGINPGNMVCEGMHVTYTAMPVFGGAAPVYTWVKNGSVVTSGPSYYSYMPVDGDDIYCTMISDYSCPTVDTVRSGTAHMTVLPFTQPVVNITADPGPLAAIGQTVTLTATVSNTGLYSALAYQWLINGIPVPGANSHKFVRSDFRYPSPDSVTCLVNCTGGPCDPVGVFSWMYIVVHPVGVASVNSALDNISLFPNPNAGEFRIRGILDPMGGNEKINMELVNMLGQVVYSNTTTTVNGNIDEHIAVDLAPGRYILRVRSADGYKTLQISIER